MATQGNPNVSDRHSSVFAAGLDTEDGTVVGLTADSKVGFYGTKPIGIQTLSSASSGGSTVAQVVAALAAAGLVFDSNE
jgi:hypothetical protein